MNDIQDDLFTASAKSALQTRVISGAVVAALALTIGAVGGVIFVAFLLLIALLMVREWDELTALEPDPAWRMVGLAYVTLPCTAAWWLREAAYGNTMEMGGALLLALVLMVVACDVAAYFTGKAIGGPKLWERLSPKKTWAGLGGGVTAAAIVGALSPFFATVPMTYAKGAIVGALIALIAQAGDLFESWLKRRADVKDSGTLIPGHGGVMDRLDGYVFALPVYAFIILCLR